MNILFVSCVLPPDNAATAIVIEKLIPFFANKGEKLEGITVKKSFCDKKCLILKDIVIHKANCVLYTPHPIRCIRDFLFAVINRIKLMLCGMTTRTAVSIYNPMVVKSLMRTMKKLPMHKYDAVFAVCAYYDAAEALLRYKKKYGLAATTVLYQVDPLAENLAYIYNNQEELMSYEKKMYEEFDFVFTTPEIMKLKQNMAWDISHIADFEFPISYNTACKEASDERDEIRCIFSGYLYGELRDASFTLDLFSKMSDPRIHFYIVGSGQKELLESYAAGRLKGRLHLLGEKSVEECDRILAEADILVNIGNTVSNQVPSKIFNYISCGKPILNVFCNQDCPTLSYMNRYPLAYNVKDLNVASNVTVSNVERWILENCNKRLSFRNVASLFEKCMPEYIVDKMLSKIKKEI